jgi:hypothetical protein
LKHLIKKSIIPYIYFKHSWVYKRRNVKLKKILRDILTGNIDKYESVSEHYRQNVEAKFDEEWAIYIKELPPEGADFMSDNKGEMIYEYEEYHWGCKQQRIEPISFLEYLRKGGESYPDDYYEEDEDPYY